MHQRLDMQIKEKCSPTAMCICLYQCICSNVSFSFFVPVDWENTSTSNNGKTLMDKQTAKRSGSCLSRVLKIHICVYMQYSRRMRGIKRLIIFCIRGLLLSVTENKRTKSWERRLLCRTLKFSRCRRSDMIFKHFFAGANHCCPYYMLSALDIEQEIAFYTNDTMKWASTLNVDCNGNERGVK